MGCGTSRGGEFTPLERSKSNRSIEQKTARVLLKDVPVIGSNRNRVPGSWITINVFVSSTFKDFHTERDLLTRIIFPKLNERCRSRRVRLVPTDLRWGLTVEDTSDKGKGVIELCLEEVERSRGWMIILLGDRYGWVPEKYKISEAQHFEWLRTCPVGLSMTELEIRHQMLRTPVHALGLFRDPGFLQTVPKQHHSIFLEPDLANKEKLEDLKQRIITSPFCSVIDGYSCTYSGVSDGKVLLKNFEEFEKQAGDFLWEAVEREFPIDTRRLDPIALEAKYHTEAIENLTLLFVGRESSFAALDQYVANPMATAATPFLVTGPRGSGKSALVAKFVTRYQAANRHGSIIIPFFVGASPNSENVRDMMYYVCGTLTNHLGEPLHHVSFDLRDLRPLLKRLLLRVVEEKKLSVLLLIDGIEHFDSAIGNAQRCAWLPHALPPGIRVIVTVKENKFLEQRRPKMQQFSIPSLLKEESRALVEAYLAHFRKKLEEHQVERILSKEDAKIPLYLIIACEEARVYGYFDRLDEFVDGLPSNVIDMFKQVLERLAENHPADILKNVFTLLAASRNGLLERELLALIARDGERQYPRGLWVRVFSEFNMYVQRPSEDGEGPIDFFYVQFEMAVRKRWMCDCPEDCDEFQKGDYCRHVHSGTVVDGWEAKDGVIHRKLAEFFYSQADPNSDLTWEGAYLGWGDAVVRSYLDRCMDELSYHLVQACMWDEVERVLTDFAFMEKRCRMGMAYDLLSDYQHAIDTMRQRAVVERERSPKVAAGLEERADRLDEYAIFLQNAAHIVHNHPNLLLQQAANLPMASAPAIAATARLEKMTTAHPWLRRLMKEDSRQEHEYVMTGHMGHVKGAAIARECLVSVDLLGEIIIWSLSSGEELARLQHMNKSKSWGSFHAVGAAPDGTSFVTGGERGGTGEATLWYLESREIGWMQALPKGVVRCVAYLPDGKRIALGGGTEDKPFLVVVSLATGEVQTTLNGHLGCVTCLCVTVSDEDDDYAPTYLVSGSYDSTLRVWDINTGECVRVLGTAKTVKTKSKGSLVNSKSSLPPAKKGDDGARAAPKGAPKKAAPKSKAAAERNERDKAERDKERVSADEGETDGRTSPPPAERDGKKHAAKTPATPVHDGKKFAGKPKENGKAPAKKDNDSPSTIASPPRERGPSLSGTTSGHVKPVLCCATSDDGRFLASGGMDDTIILWNIAEVGAAKWRAAHLLDGHDNDVEALCFSPDSSYLYSCSRDETLRTWDTENGKQLCMLKGDKAASCQCLFDDKNRLLLTAGEYVLKAWAESHIQKCIATPERIGQQGTVTAITFSPDGAFFGAGFGDIEEPGRPPKKSTNTVCIYRAGETSAKPIREYNGHTQRVTCLAFSPDGMQILSGSADTTLRVWDTSSSKEVHVFSGHTDPVLLCCYSHDGSVIASSAGSEAARVSLKLWDATATRTRATSTSIANLSGHRSCITSLLFSADSAWLVSADALDVRVWDVENESCLCVITERANARPSHVLFMPSSSSLFVTYGAAGSWLYTLTPNADDGAGEGGSLTFDAAWSASEAAAHCCVSANGQFLATAADGPDEGVLVYRVAGGRPDLSSVVRLTPPVQGCPTVLLGFTQTDSPVLVQVLIDKVSEILSTVCLWRPSPGTLLNALTYHHPIPNVVAASASGRCIGGGDAEGTISLLSIEGIPELRSGVR